MHVSKQHILAEILRTAENNNGKPLGRRRFASATGIRQHDWSGVYWANWSEAVREAGLPPNRESTPVSPERICEELIDLTRELGRFPSRAQRQLKRRRDPSFVGGAALARIGGTRELLELVLDYCRKQPGYEDIVRICEPLEQALDRPQRRSAGKAFSYVYLFRSGRYYKLGHSALPGRRHGELSIQLPQALVVIHTIKTDDPAGVEAYWHKRLHDKRVNGEWFVLTREDVQMFKRRTFM